MNKSIEVITVVTQSYVKLIYMLGHWEMLSCVNTHGSTKWYISHCINELPKFITEATGLHVTSATLIKSKPPTTSEALDLQKKLANIANAEFAQLRIDRLTVMLKKQEGLMGLSKLNLSHPDFVEMPIPAENIVEKDNDTAPSDKSHQTFAQSFLNKFY